MIEQLENEMKTKHLRYQDAYGVPHPDKDQDEKELHDKLSKLLANNWYTKLSLGN